MPVVPEPAATVSSTGLYQQPTAMPSSPQPQHTASSPNSGNAFLIAIEAIFSCLVIVVLLFCFFTGVRKKKRARVNQQQMIENAITQQERRIQLHLQGRGGTTGLSFGTKSNMHNDDNDINNKAQ
ncbi:hypothetical protein PS6_004607 [Mucor atramentarius]